MDIWTLTAAALLVSSTVAPSSEIYVMEGEWKLDYSASSDLHRLLFVEPNNNHARVYLSCEPDSRHIQMYFEAPLGDIRTYKPKIRTENLVEARAFMVEYDDVSYQYMVRVALSPDEQFVESLVTGSDLLLDDERYGIDLPLDGQLFREFRRACGGNK